LVGSSGGEVSCSNVVERMNSLEHLGDDLDSEIAFAASHFFEISSSDLSSLSFSAFIEVARHSDLKLVSEDSLFELICQRIPSDSRFFDVLQFVQFEFLSVANFAKFFDFVCKSFNCFTISHWASFHLRLLLPLSLPLPNGRCSKPARGFPYHSSPLDGIISHLTSKFGGNVHNRGGVIITANRVYNSDPSHAVKNVADFGTDSVFNFANEPNQSISFDFRNLTITPTYYSFRMYTPA
jgi:hypothetical protein